MDVTRIDNYTFNLEFTDYEIDLFGQFGSLLGLETTDVIEIYLRSMYNFQVQFLSKVEYYGPRPDGP